MFRVALNGRAYERKPTETVLDALLRAGVDVPHACRKGTCRVCLMQRLDGLDARGAQDGLRAALRSTGHFLPCRFTPPGDVTIGFPRDRTLVHRAVVLEKAPLSAEVCRVRLESTRLFRYHPGQFVVLRRPDGLARSYSLGSVPALDEPMELHVRRVPGGAMSTWIADELSPGDTVEIRGPHGECFYVPGEPEQPLLLVATGTGLAPLWGIIRDALACGHEGPIRLYHGSRSLAGLYLRSELEAMAREHRRMEYVPCLSGAEARGVARGRADDVALSRHAVLSGWRVFLCGLPDMVHGTRRRAYLAGARLEDILLDAFESA